MYVVIFWLSTLVLEVQEILSSSQVCLSRWEDNMETCATCETNTERHSTESHIATATLQSLWQVEDDYQSYFATISTGQRKLPFYWEPKCSFVSWNIKFLSGKTTVILIKRFTKLLQNSFCFRSNSVAYLWSLWLSNPNANLSTETRSVYGFYHIHLRLTFSKDLPA